MNNRDFNTIKECTNELNQKYGNNFGYNVMLYTTIASIIFIILVLGTQHIIKWKTSSEEFSLDSNSKYLISIDFPKNYIYYEVDFQNNKVIERHDTDLYRREKISTIKTDLNELKQFILEITNDENNLELTEVEKEKLFQQNSYRIYRITTYENKNYYIKDINKVEYLKELLNR